VLTVKPEVPEPLATEAGTKAQVGGDETTGVTVQVRPTALLNPLAGVIVIVEVADPLAASEAGVRVEAAMVKSGIAVTVRASGVVWFKAPELLSTVMV